MGKHTQQIPTLKWHGFWNYLTKTKLSIITLFQEVRANILDMNGRMECLSKYNI